MEKNSEISVIMSVYNSEKYLDQSIQSILDQSSRDFEFIIVNDASTDRSLEIIKKYQKRDERIILLNNEKNIGLTKSLNEALNEAKGSYIARQDADDVSLPERLGKQYRLLEKTKNVFLCGTSGIDIDEKGNILRDNGRVIVGCEKVKKRLRKGNCIIHSSIMFRNHGFTYRDKFRYSQDYDFYLNLLTKGLKLDNLEEKLIEYRTVPSNTCTLKKNKQVLFAKKARTFYRQRIKTGKDKYGEFDPLEILGMEGNDPKKVFLELNMEIHLKGKDPNSARRVLFEYKKLESVSYIDSLPYSICIGFPSVYKVYRRFCYGD
ncbi:MAG: glycosyltransferase [Deltaproteobacteria bacterium]|nr:glycosyltransferase [Deltaproteobacteria bacterium]